MAAETTPEFRGGSLPCLGKGPPGKAAGDLTADSGLAIDLHGDPLCKQALLQSLLL